MKAIKKKPAKKKIELERIPDGQLVIGLDVSSTAAGWAVGVREGNTTKVIDFGVVAPPKHWDATRRMEIIIPEISQICRSRIRFGGGPLGIPRIVMEWQSHLRAAGNRTANGLAILGKSQGAVWWELRSRGLQIDHVSERVWTKVNGWPARKEDRAKLIRLAVPDYRKAVEKDANLDPGLDIADGIGLTLFRLAI
jgi:hypothetical protein